MDNATKQKLWKTADQLRSNMDAAEYKHVVLGLIFLKYISDSFLYFNVKECIGMLLLKTFFTRIR